MIIALNISLIILFVLAYIQDRKQREIHLLIFLGVGAASTIIFLNTDLVLRTLLMNLVFTIVVIAGLVLYLSLKEQRAVNIFKSHFGLGDLVFLIVVSPLFANQNFILFFITGTVFSAIMHVLMSQLKRGGETVPLAGYMSAYLIMLKTADFLIEKDLFYTDII